MSSAGCIFSRTVVSTSETVIQERTCFRGLDPEVRVLFESSFHAGNIDVPLLDMPRFEKMGERVKLSEILPVNHRRNGHTDVFCLEVVNGRKTLFEGSLSSERFVSFFHSVEADLNFMNPKFSRHVSGDQHSIGEEDRPESVIFQHLVERPELGVKQRFASGKEKA
jgi:6-phosphogluconolactonase (cycloisomerase 2 family)